MAHVHSFFPHHRAQPQEGGVHPVRALRSRLSEYLLATAEVAEWMNAERTRAAVRKQHKG